MGKSENEIETSESEEEFSSTSSNDTIGGRKIALKTSWGSDIQNRMKNLSQETVNELIKFKKSKLDLEDAFKPEIEEIFLGKLKKFTKTNNSESNSSTNQSFFNLNHANLLMDCFSKGISAQIKNTGEPIFNFHKNLMNQVCINENNSSTNHEDESKNERKNLVNEEPCSSSSLLPTNEITEKSSTTTEENLPKKKKEKDLSKETKAPEHQIHIETITIIDDVEPLAAQTSPENMQNTQFYHSPKSVEVITLDEDSSKIPQNKTQAQNEMTFSTPIPNNNPRNILLSPLSNISPLSQGAFADEINLNVESDQDAMMESRALFNLENIQTVEGIESRSTISKFETTPKSVKRQLNLPTLSPFSEYPIFDYSSEECCPHSLRLERYRKILKASRKLSLCENKENETLVQNEAQIEIREDISLPQIEVNVPHLNCTGGNDEIKVEVEMNATLSVPNMSEEESGDLTFFIKEEEDESVKNSRADIFLTMAEEEINSLVTQLHKIHFYNIGINVDGEKLAKLHRRIVRKIISIHKMYITPSKSNQGSSPPESSCSKSSESEVFYEKALNLIENEKCCGEGVSIFSDAHEKSALEAHQTLSNMYRKSTRNITKNYIHIPKVEENKKELHERVFKFHEWVFYILLHDDGCTKRIRMRNYMRELHDSINTYVSTREGNKSLDGASTTSTTTNSTTGSTMGSTAIDNKTKALKLTHKNKNEETYESESYKWVSVSDILMNCIPELSIRSITYTLVALIHLMAEKRLFLNELMSSESFDGTLCRDVSSLLLLLNPVPLPTPSESLIVEIIDEFEAHPTFQEKFQNEIVRRCDKVNPFL